MKISRLKKALYGLKKALRAWYSRLDKYLHQQDLKRRIVDNSLYIKTKGEDQLIVLVYVDDSIFGSNSDKMIQNVVEEINNEFDMSMLSELSFFIFLYISKINKGIVIS